MFKIFFVPPVIVAIYLVINNWADMYQEPGIIVIPVIFEIAAFLMWFTVAATTHWVLVLPSSYLMIKSTGSRFGGVVLGVIFASVIPCIMVTLDWPDFSWRGTLSSTHILQVMLPFLFLSIYGYLLLHRYFIKHYGATLLPWLTASVLRTISVGVVIVLFGFTIVTVYFNQPPISSPIVLEQQDNVIKGRVLLQAHQHVINNLLNKRGGLMRDSLVPPFVLLDNHQYWERGVETQMYTFGRLLNHINFFFENPVKSTKRRPQVPFILETPKELKQANDNIKQATITKKPAEAEMLYRQALLGIEQMESRLISTDVRVKRQRKLKWWFQDAAMNIAQPALKASMNSQIIEQALHPRKYSPRESALFAIQPLWKEDDALYEAYGSAWALSIYLDAIAAEYKATLDTANAMPILERVRAELQQCLPGVWTPVLITPVDITNLQQEMQRIYKHMNAAMLGLNELTSVIPR